MVWTNEPMEVQSDEWSNVKWLRDGLTGRNKNGLNCIAICTGPTGSGKSKMLAKLIEKIDPTFTPSLANPPGPDRHLSVSPLPFFQALEENKLSPGTWWELDEPVGIKNTEWMKIIGQAIRDFATAGLRFKVVNLAISSPFLYKRAAQIDLRELAHLWIRMHKPGFASVYKFKRYLNYSSANREEIIKPKHIGELENVPLPSKLFEELYPPIKEFGWQEILHKHMDILRKAGYFT